MKESKARGAPGRKSADKAQKAEFARRLQTALVEKGWNQSDLARQAGLFMPGRKFGRDNVSKYLNQFTLPTPLHLNALAKALGKDPADLLPNARTMLLSTDMEERPTIAMRTLDNGRAWIRINQDVPLAVALKIVGLLKAEEQA